MNGIIVTENYIIFEGDNLTAKRHWEWLSPGRWGVRNENTTDPDPSRHTRWVFVISEHQEQWEDHVIDEGGVRRNGYWNQHDGKEYKKMKNTFTWNNGLKSVFERILEDDDLGEGINFAGGVLSDDQQDNIENLWFIIEKDYLKEVVDLMAYPTGLSTRAERNGIDQEIMFIRSNFAEVEQFIREKGENIVENNHTPTNNPQTPHPMEGENNDLEKYNDDTINLILNLTEENEDIISQGNEKYAILISLEKDGGNEVKEQIDIINEEMGVDWFEYKEEGQTNNQHQQIENQNKIQIDNYRNWLARKKEAIKKLETIINKVNQEKPTEKNPKPGSHNPNPAKEGEQKNKNPISENNKNSNENIEEISQLSLQEAKIKAKKEIETLLDRYGVKSPELDNKIWEKFENWEKFLESLSDNEKVKWFVKKMKIAIVQQNNKNNQEITNLSIEKVRQNSQNQINELLQKYNIKPNHLDKSLWNGEENWEKYLERLTDKKEILNFAHKMREAIIHNSLTKNNKNDKRETPNKSNNLPLTLILIPTLLLFLIGSAIIIRKRKVKRF